MFHFLKNQIEVSHKSVYKYLYKELKLKIETLRLLLAELLTNYEISIFKSSREYSLPDIPDHNDYGDTKLYDEKSHFLLEDTQINSLKFPRPKFNVSNKFPKEKTSDREILKRMMMSSEQNKSMYPEFDVKLENSFSSSTPERRLRKQSKCLHKELKRQPVYINFLHMSKDSSLLMIPVIINDICYSFLVDPGAEKSVINIQIIPKDIQLNQANVSLSTCTSKSVDIVEGSAVLPTIFIDNKNIKYTNYIDYLVLNSTNGFAGILGNDIFRCKNSISINFEDKQWEVRINRKIKYFQLFPFEKSILVNLVAQEKVTLQHSQRMTVLCKINIHEDSLLDKLNKIESDSENDVMNRHEVKIQHTSTKQNKLLSDNYFEIGYFQNDKFSILDTRGFTADVKDNFQYIKIDNFSGADIIFEQGQSLFPAHQCFTKRNDIKLMNMDLNKEEEITANKKLTKEMVYSDLRKYFPTKPDIQVFKEFADEMSQIPTPKANSNISADEKINTDFKHKNLEVLDDDFLDKTDKQTVLLDTEIINTKYKISDITLDNVKEIKKNEDLIKKYRDIFSKNPYDVGNSDLLEADIDVSKIPKRQQHRLIPPDKIKLAQEIIDKYIENGVLSVCPNPLYTSNLVLIAKYKPLNSLGDTSGLHKTDDDIISYKLCQDLRALNAVIEVKCNTALSNPLSDLSKFEGKIMSTLDASQAYLSIKLNEYAKRYTAFYFDKKIYCWNRLSQGLLDSSRLFTEYLNMVFSEASLRDALKELTLPEYELLQRKCGEVSWSKFLDFYFENIWIFSNDHDLHYIHLKLAFHALHTAKLKINPSRARLYTYECDILGHKFNSKNIELFMDEYLLSHILSWDRPNSCFELHSKLCTLFYLVRFLPLLKHFSLPLIEILKSKKFKWSQTENIAWSNIMLLVKLDLHLTIPTKHDKLILFSDASKYCCSQILFVEKEGYLKLVACNSAVFGKQDVKKAPYIKECISLIKGLKTFEPYIASSTEKTVVFCDALSIVYVNRSKSFETNSFNLVNHLVYYQKVYNFQLLHIPGKYNVLSDLCSRSFKNSRYFKNELVLSKKKARMLPPLPEKAFFDSDTLYKYLVQECPPEMSDHFDKKIKNPAVPRPLKHLSKLYKDKTPEENCYFASKLLENDNLDPRYKSLKKLDNTQLLKKRVCKLNSLNMKYKSHMDYLKPDTIDEVNKILNKDPSVIFCSEKLYDGEILCRYNYLIQPNQSISISTGLKIKTGAPILVISKHENLNLNYSEIVKDCDLSLTFTNLSKSLVELRPGDVLAKLFSNSNPICIEEKLFDQIHLPVSYLPNLPFPFIGNQTIIDSYQYKLPCPSKKGNKYIHPRQPSNL